MVSLEPMKNTRIAGKTYTPCRGCRSLDGLDLLEHDAGADSTSVSVVEDELGVELLGIDLVEARATFVRMLLGEEIGLNSVFGVELHRHLEITHDDVAGGFVREDVLDVLVVHLYSE